jgi:hypothetical protein
MELKENIFKSKGYMVTMFYQMENFNKEIEMIKKRTK